MSCVKHVECQVWVQGLPLSASELNLAAWADPGPSQAVAAGDLSIIPRNFSLSDLAFDQQDGLPRITSRSDLDALQRSQARDAAQQQQQHRQTQQQQQQQQQQSQPQQQLPEQRH